MTNDSEIFSIYRLESELPENVCNFFNINIIFHQIFVEFLQGVQTNILAIFGYLDLLKFQS